MNAAAERHKRQVMESVRMMTSQQIREWMNTESNCTVKIWLYQYLQTL
jgi:hypothetical protein